MTFHAFTSITSNYIPKARVLAKSLKRQHPEASFHLLLCDFPPQNFNIKNEPFDSLILIDELPINNLRSWIFMHSVVEMCTGVKPLALQEIIKRYKCEKVLYFDPDMVIFNKLDDILNRLDKNSILLTPHQTEPEASLDAVMDNEICSLRHGVFNLGFIAIKDTNKSQKFLDWWSNRCLNFCYDDIPGGLFTDQKWIDLAPAFFDDVGILREPVYNVATWNLTNRHISGSLQENVFVNDKPMIFYHFSGFDSGAQEIMLKKYAPCGSPLFELRQWYLKECNKNGQEEFGKMPCHYSFFDNEIKINTRQRELYRSRRDLQIAFPNPFFVSESEGSYFYWYENEISQISDKGMIASSKSLDTFNKLKVEMDFLKSKIQGMESSKFWKIRNIWFRFKNFFVIQE